MNRFLLTAVAVAVLMGSQSGLFAQEPASVSQKTALERLAVLKTANAELLKKQQETLQKLDELKLQADQLRIMTKRS